MDTIGIVLYNVYTKDVMCLEYTVNLLETLPGIAMSSAYTHVTA